jgi:hypothetical protein
MPKNNENNIVSGTISRRGSAPCIGDEQYVFCDICQCRYRASECQKQWNGYITCKFDFYPRPWFLDIPEIDPMEGNNTLADPRPKARVTTINPGPNPSIPSYLGSFIQ